MANIGILTHSYYLRDPRVRREAETLQRSGHSVVVICLRQANELKYEEVNGVLIYRIPLSHKRGNVFDYLLEYISSFFLFSSWLTALHFFKNRFELVQVNTPPDLLVFSVFICKFTGTKVLMDIHDPMPELFATKFNKRLNGGIISLIKWMEKVATSFSDYVITVTEQVKVALTQRGLSCDKVTVIMNFSDPHIFKSLEAKSQSSKKQDRLNNRPILLFMGTLTRAYGIDIAIRSLPILQKKFSNICLKIIGDGEDRPYLERLVTTLALTHAVQFIGMIPIHRIPYVALPADIGLAPHRRDTLYDMCFPSKIYDYLSLGLPVVTCRTVSLAYYYGEETLSFFESEDVQGLADRIQEILVHHEKAELLISNSKLFILKRNWHQEKRHFLKVVERLLV